MTNKRKYKRFRNGQKKEAKIQCTKKKRKEILSKYKSTSKELLKLLDLPLYALLRLLPSTILTEYCTDELFSNFRKFLQDIEEEMSNDL